MNTPRKITPYQSKTIDAMVQYNATGFHRYRLRDVQIEGAFVEMGNVRVLRKDTPVQVVFVHLEAGHCHTHRLEAKVDRIDENGAQLKFFALDDQAQAALGKIQHS